MKQEIYKEIEENTEWLLTTEVDEVECIGVENLHGILDKYLPDENNDEYAINVKRLAEALSEEWFKEHYEYRLSPRELYDIDIIEGHTYILISNLKNEYSSIFWNRVEFYKDWILKFSDI